MKRTISFMLAALTMMTGASAQKTERIKEDVGGYFFGDAVKLDSMYNYWNDFVVQHPNDEIAWRNLFDVSESKVYQMLNQRMQHSERPGNMQAVEDYRKQLNVVGRMEKAIPCTYTFYYSAYMGSYKPEVPEGTDVTTLFMHTEAYADSAIARLPEDARAEVLEELPAPLHQIFSLHYQEELTIPQIAEIVGVPEGTIKSRLHKTMNIIRKKLKQYENH